MGKRKITKSRQRQWQDKRRKAGLCISCGIEPLFTKNHGIKCAKNIREAARARTGAKTRYKNARSYSAPKKRRAAKAR